MKIETKFDLGQELFYITWESADRFSESRPTAQGPFFVYAIKTRSESGGTNTYYSGSMVWEDGGGFKHTHHESTMGEENCFLTQESAQAEAKRRWNARCEAKKM